MERFWQKGPDGVESEFAYFGNMVCPTGQKRRRLPDGNYLHFTVLDTDPNVIDLPPADEDDDVIELSAEDIEVIEDPDDFVITFDISDT